MAFVASDTLNPRRKRAVFVSSSAVERAVAVIGSMVERVRLESSERRRSAIFFPTPLMDSKALAFFLRTAFASASGVSAPIMDNPKEGPMP